MVLILLKASLFLKILPHISFVEIIWLQIIADISKITKSADRKPMLIFPELLKSAITFSQKSLLFLKKKKAVSNKYL